MPTAQPTGPTVKQSNEPRPKEQNEAMPTVLVLAVKNKQPKLKQDARLGAAEVKNQ